MSKNASRCSSVSDTPLRSLKIASSSVIGLPARSTISRAVMVMPKCLVVWRHAA